MEIHFLTVLGTRSLKSSVGRTGSFGVVKEVLSPSIWWFSGNAWLLFYAPICIHLTLTGPHPN